MDYLIHHMLRASACRFPGKEAVVHRAQRLTYAEVWEQVEGLAAGLIESGLQRGDRIGIYLDASIEQTLSIFAISRGAGVFVPINGLLFQDQVAHIARDCGMRGLITSRSKMITLGPILSDIPSLEFLVLVNDDGPAEASLPSKGFEELCGRAGLPSSHDPSIDKDLAAILYTSGSTGKPKGVMLSHAQVRAGSSIVSTYLEITDRDRILALLPFSFDAGMNQVMTAFQQGATLILMSFVFAREIVHILLQERITGLAGVPTLWSLVAQPSSSLARQPLPHLRYITNTGGTMPQTVLEVLRAALPTTRIFLMYGLTEAFRSTYLPPDQLDRRPTSIGKAIPNTEILVINEKGALCGPGEVGELVHRGPTVSMGYWGAPELSARVLRPHPLKPAELGHDEMVCYSGDYVTKDEEGFLYFVGRRDTMIKTSGFRVSPTEVEEILLHSGLVKGAAVIGLPDMVLGQSIKAFVSACDGDSFDADELLKFCAMKMPRHMVPRSIEVLPELPKTTSGKVDYPALRKRAGA